MAKQESSHWPGTHYRHSSAPSANFADRDGKPFVFQLGGRVWEKAMIALGFDETLEARGIADLGLAVSSQDKRYEILADTASKFMARLGNFPRRLRKSD